MYWIYRTHIYTWRNQYVQAKLVAPSLRDLMKQQRSQDFQSPLQDEPYGFDLKLTYQINPKHSQPDNYFQSAGFMLFSERLVALMQAFGVKFESFPVTMLDKQGNLQPDLKYFVFHSLEGVLDALNEEASHWTGDYDTGVPRLVLDYTKFKQRPMFKCNHLYIPLLRDDLKHAIQEQGITGFDFLALDKYHSGNFGPLSEFND